MMHKTSLAQSLWCIRRLPTLFSSLHSLQSFLYFFRSVTRARNFYNGEGSSGWILCVYSRGHPKFLKDPPLVPFIVVGRDTNATFYFDSVTTYCLHALTSSALTSRVSISWCNARCHISSLGAATSPPLSADAR
ncbi:hypothetical protein F5148DRAFT_1168725 [Russula earlei]|uniref:Uncharacterized protein n=1 Tax=Russula earlei TaxID=71964 RepID=A0ACC0UJ74_9AGAM|nr:hypothetical protein F5148DRAFT_1168725 [Russula earlei]